MYCVLKLLTVYYASAILNVFVYHDSCCIITFNPLKIWGEMRKGKEKWKTMVAADFRCMLFGYYCPMPACGRIG